MLSYALLVDGGFIKRKLGSQKSPMSASSFGDFLLQVQKHESLENHRLHRVYFYDAKPLEDEVTKPLGAEKIDLSKQPTVTINRELHDNLVKLPFVALRLGELVYRGWKPKKGILTERGATSVTLNSGSLQPDIQQKGVDMRIGLDIAALTLKHQVEIIVLVTGDSDFVPAMKFARREGAQLFLITLGHSVRDPMREHSDLVIESTFNMQPLAKRTGERPPKAAKAQPA